MTALRQRLIAIRDDAAPEVALEPVTADQAGVLTHLFQLYAHDFSEYVPLELEPTGLFDVTLEEPWFASDDHFPFFIRRGGQLTGFALVRRGSRITSDRDVMDVAEFFVVRGARIKKIGTTVAHALFQACPGRWEIRVRQANVPATKFWSRTAEAWARRPVESTAFASDGVDWNVFRLKSPA